MAGVEVTRERVAEHERAGWAQRYMVLMQEYAQQQAVVEALQEEVGRLHETAVQLTQRLGEYENDRTDGAKQPGAAVT